MPQGFASFRDLEQATLPDAATLGMLPPSTMEGDPQPTTAASGAVSFNEFGGPQRAGTEDGTLDSAVDHLSTIMASGMSLAGGGKGSPVGMALAGLGGAGGEAYRQVIRALEGRWDEVPPTMRRQAQAIIGEGVRQGGLEGFGRVFGGLFKLFGRATYRGAQKPPEVIRRQFKTVSRDALNEGIPITRTGKGTAIAQDKLRESGAATENMLARAEAGGARAVNPRAVAHALGEVRARIGDQPLREADLQRLQAIRDQFLKENPSSIPLTRAQRMKQRAQSQAERAYRLRERGGAVNDVDLMADEALARGFRESIERRAPEVGPQNQRTQRLIGVARATERAEDRIANRDPIGMGDYLSAGAGLASATVDPVLGGVVGLGTTLANRPEIASRLAIGLNRGGPAAGGQLARAVDAWVRLSESLVPMPAHTTERR